MGSSRDRRAPHALTDRFHDLRHSLASVAAGGGEELHMIGKMQGHTQPQTTARYAHLATDPVKAATEKVGARITALLDGSESKTSSQ